MKSHQALTLVFTFQSFFAALLRNCNFVCATALYGVFIFGTSVDQKKIREPFFLSKSKVQKNKDE